LTGGREQDQADDSRDERAHNRATREQLLHTSRREEYGQRQHYGDVPVGVVRLFPRVTADPDGVAHLSDATGGDEPQPRVGTGEQAECERQPQIGLDGFPERRGSSCDPSVNGMPATFR
jgi:hypothetical protein